MRRVTHRKGKCPSQKNWDKGRSLWGGFGGRSFGSQEAALDVWGVGAQGEVRRGELYRES